MAVIERKTKRSPTDLTDEEWAQAGGRAARGAERDSLDDAFGWRFWRLRQR